MFVIHIQSSIFLLWMTICINSQKQYINSMFLLGIKFITWYLYNFKGMTVFSGLLFQYSEGWTRNGFMRMDTGALFGIVLCVTLYYCFVKKQLLYLLVLAFLYVYLIFVTQYRFQIIVKASVNGIWILLLNRFQQKKEHQTDGDFYYYYCVCPIWRLRLSSEFVFA